MHDGAETQGIVEVLTEHDSHDIETSVATEKSLRVFGSPHCGMSRASGCSAYSFLCILPNLLMKQSF